MKKGLLFAAVAITLVFGMSSCTKEQQFLKTLNGDWRLDTEKDDDGDVITYGQFVTSYEEIWTFFDCNLKVKEYCSGTTITTTVTTIPSGGGTTTNTSVQSGTFTYNVDEKDMLVVGSTVYIIDDVSKKSLTIHRPGHELATMEFSKK